MKNHICFNQKYNVLTLQNELAIANTWNWHKHFNSNDYQGKWESISLRSATGNTDDILANYNQKHYQNTPLLKQMPYISNILGEFLCDLESVRLLALYPGAEIKPHRDRGCEYKNGYLRLHIPIQTNPEVNFTVGGERLFLEEGSLWYINFDQVHSIQNNGSEVRVHLVIDGIRNQWTDNLFTSHGYDLNDENNGGAEYDRETMLNMIAAFEVMNSPTALALIEEYKKKIDELG